MDYGKYEAHALQQLEKSVPNRPKTTVVQFNDDDAVNQLDFGMRKSKLQTTPKANPKQVLEQVLLEKQAQLQNTQPIQQQEKIEADTDVEQQYPARQASYFQKLFELQNRITTPPAVQNQKLSLLKDLIGNQSQQLYEQTKLKILAELQQTQNTLFQMFKLLGVNDLTQMLTKQQKEKMKLKTVQSEIMSIKVKLPVLKQDIIQCTQQCQQSIQALLDALCSSNIEQ
ncbi:Hypothetical_protein [Hexamita inflata]|uniref:Hypothetical_protein n=1 Tax=Hexamita inflata TaxID=28002 RepID=A0AA86RDG6_9EUKA|nr:Hypothetical protein HINF_LOCUS4814 [Hexamita inflata]CAI9919963.1 Hypothetical protein HINF_LOCUS7608 [Hexamita inflata]CAI9971976.1 Hypothetical protein HINF_LOCUS59621 [Hexamita inflata]